MAVTKSLLLNTHQEAVVKVAGSDAAATIALATDILSHNQALDGATQDAAVMAVQWTGVSGGTIKITRNSVDIMNLQSAPAGQIAFDGQAMAPEITESTSDIVVTITGTAECWIRLRKRSGYKPTVEYATFGAHDDETVAGA